MKIKYTYIIVIVLIVLSGALAYDAFSSYVSPYLTVSQVVENSAAYYNKEEIQVIGTVANGSVTYGNTFMVFNLTDEEFAIKVNYTGTPRPPQGFQPGGQVVVIGKLVSPSTIEGYDMLVKCPSKYEGGEKSLLTDPVFLVAILLGSVAIVGTVVSIAWKRKQHEV
ncbi:MAG: cytochrome c maturation protein CcmE [Candidatus Bathyarchaeia archaeon]